MQDQEKPSKQVRIARVILRAVLREPGITRTHLSVQVRPYGAEWVEVLELLKTEGVIEEFPQIVSRTGKHKRAAIAYRPSSTLTLAGLDFEYLTAADILRAIPALATLAAA